jgi:NADPH:quinone reductase
MAHAIRLKEYGEPEVLSWQQVEVGKPAAGQVRIRQTAVGVNFMDVSQRRGRSPIPLALPGGLGGEAAGIIEELGEGVADLAVGDRVVYAGGGAGAYAQARIVPVQILVGLPDGLSDQQAAAMMLKGMTAQFLVRWISRVKAGDTVLFHAASSGVGFIACQWLKYLGVRVIGTVSSDEKAETRARMGATTSSSIRARTSLGAPRRSRVERRCPSYLTASAKTPLSNPWTASSPAAWLFCMARRRVRSGRSILVFSQTKAPYS